MLGKLFFVPKISYLNYFFYIPRFDPFCYHPIFSSAYFFVENMYGFNPYLYKVLLLEKLHIFIMRLPIFFPFFTLK